MEVISLQSGSNGNCYYVEAGGVQLLVDAGISGRQAEMRLAEHGRKISDVDGLLITHDHNDHARSMGVFHRKFGIPVYVTRRTYDAASRWCNIGEIDDIRSFKPGETLRFGNDDDPVLAHTIPTPHDGAEAVVYVIEYGDSRLGILTDLGHVFDGLRDVLLTLDAVIIESNYDDRMLKHGSYPESVKRRIAGPGGHISNREAAELVSKVTMFGRLKWACLCHLSDENNCPDVARQTFENIVGKSHPVYIASRFGVSDVLKL